MSKDPLRRIVDECIEQAAVELVDNTSSWHAIIKALPITTALIFWTGSGSTGERAASRSQDISMG